MYSSLTNKSTFINLKNTLKFTWKCRSGFYVYFNVNFIVFFKSIKVNLLASELYTKQNHFTAHVNKLWNFVNFRQQYLIPHYISIDKGLTSWTENAEVRQVHVGFTVDKVALQANVLQAPLFFFLSSYFNRRSVLTFHRYVIDTT